MCRLINIINILEICLSKAQSDVTNNKEKQFTFHVLHPTVKWTKCLAQFPSGVGPGFLMEVGKSYKKPNYILIILWHAMMPGHWSSSLIFKLFTGPLLEVFSFFWSHSQKPINFLHHDQFFVVVIKKSCSDIKNLSVVQKAHGLLESRKLGMWTR